MILGTMIATSMLTTLFCFFIWYGFDEGYRDAIPPFVFLLIVMLLAWYSGYCIGKEVLL